MQIASKTVALAILSSFTAGFTATSLLRADLQRQRSATSQVALQVLPTPVSRASLPFHPNIHHSLHAHPLEAAPAEMLPTSYHPTALEVAGNPHRFIGARVHWTCKVDLVPEPAFADAYCGPPVPSFVQPPLSSDQLENDPDAVARSVSSAQSSLHGALRALENRAMIVLTGYSVASLDHGETIVMDGTVRHPLRGENAFGVTRAYPTVHIDSIEAENVFPSR